MEIEISRNRIEGFCDGSPVIAFSKRNNKWSTAHSCCLPSNVDNAIRIIECMDRVSDILKESINPSCGKCKHFGLQQIFLSGCTGCFVVYAYDKFELKI